MILSFTDLLRQAQGDYGSERFTNPDFRDVHDPYPSYPYGKNDPYGGNFLGLQNAGLLRLGGDRFADPFNAGDPGSPTPDTGDLPGDLAHGMGLFGDIASVLTAPAQFALGLFGNLATDRFDPNKPLSKLGRSLFDAFDPYNYDPYDTLNTDLFGPEAYGGGFGPDMGGYGYDAYDTSNPAFGAESYGGGFGPDDGTDGGTGGFGDTGGGATGDGSDSGDQFD